MEKVTNALGTVIPDIASDILQIIFGVIALFLSAFVYIYIPGNPVPITLQVFSVLMIASIFSKKNGLLATFSYLLIGGLGLPIFAGATGGLSHLCGPTGGYLIGFLVAVYIIPRLRKHIGLFPSLLAGLLSIHFLGLAQLSFFLHMSFSKAFSLGILPFIVYDVIKLLAVYFIAKRKRGF